MVGMLRIRYYMKKKSQSGAIEGKQTVKQYIIVGRSKAGKEIVVEECCFI